MSMKVIIFQYTRRLSIRSFMSKKLIHWHICQRINQFLNAKHFDFADFKDQLLFTLTIFFLFAVSFCRKNFFFQRGNFSFVAFFFFWRNLFLFYWEQILLPLAFFFYRELFSLAWPAFLSRVFFLRRELFSFALKLVGYRIHVIIDSILNYNCWFPYGYLFWKIKNNTNTI